ncbi:hypothetical protein AL28_02081 [Mycobacterium tuberculosis TKK_03_0059]|nr:hypothetical protein AL28_02081 [Mycobacterium tuberculosis TKK_03_0059]KBV80318.1 hypothetical protein G066_05990 [Mycobacterium tuberculosis TKK-01-0072]
MNDPWPRPTQGPAKTIETDYLVIGAGAMGMAFTDTLITESGARVVMIDRACQPGGHWTTAYPFVRLHQPSAYYGVNSRALGNNTIDLVGWNQGLNELAPVGEICAYFDAVLQQQLLPTGRVDYFPMSEYLGDGRFRTLAGTEYVVTVNRTPMTDWVPEDIFQTALGRAAEPVEVSNLVVYLASDESSYSTGAEFVVDGGTVAGLAHNDFGAVEVSSQPEWVT